jgi:hypothetical protein
MNRNKRYKSGDATRLRRSTSRRGNNRYGVRRQAITRTRLIERTTMPRSLPRSLRGSAGRSWQPVVRRR